SPLQSSDKKNKERDDDYRNVSQENTSFSQLKYSAEKERELSPSDVESEQSYLDVDTPSLSLKSKTALKERFRSYRKLDKSSV
ncbi:hypothetical protein K7R09_26025, partial [Serratia ureilytica]|uniref:hypothetical protein n=1 Tax=Serratia ureilytica TaxID=300181 RepID=UPI0021D48DC8